MFMHCIIKEGREKMRDLNIITVSGTVNREPAYKENKENPNRTILYYSIEIYTGRDYYPDKEKKQLVHEKIYLNCVNYGKTAMELVNKVKKGSYVQVSGELRPNNYDREDGKVYGYFLEKGQVVKREYLYLHFKRRKMQINIPFEADKYLIVPSGFETYKEVTADVIKHYAKKKWFYPVFWEEVKKSIVRKFTKNNGR